MNAHTSIFFCAGGDCKIKQCIFCVTLIRAKEEVQRCFHCGMLKDLCACGGVTRVESRFNNSP